MNARVLGERVTRAREIAGMTQDGLARAVGLERTAVTRLEKGERKISVPEMVSIAAALGRPLAFFVEADVPAVVSRRVDTATAHETTHELDIELGQFAADVRVLVDMGLLAPADRPAARPIPQDHDAAEQLATAVRRQLQLDSSPVADLAETCQRLGLQTYARPLGDGGPDGGCVEVDDTGVAVINSEAPAGRRRMTLAHELGHWLSGDAYDHQASADSERMLNSFAIHLLAPRAGVTALWTEHSTWPDRDRAMAVGAAFRLSWSATVAQLRNLGLIDFDDHRRLSSHEPRSGDYVRLRLSWDDELAGTYLSPDFAAACVNGYMSRQLTEARTIELLRGTLTADQLPDRTALGIDDLRRSFAGHDG